MMPNELHQQQVEESSSTITALRQQEECRAYACGEYLQSGPLEQLLELDSSSFDQNEGSDAIHPLKKAATRGRTRPPRHPHHRSTRSCPAVVDAATRQIMVDWTFRVVDHLSFSHETVAVAIAVLDKFLLTPEGSKYLQSTLDFKLATMTCLYTAAKLHESSVMSSQIMSTLSQGVFSSQQVEAMELLILKAMNWHVNPPTAIAFVREFLKLLPESDETKDIALGLCKAQTEAAVREAQYTSVKASTVAYHAVMNALKGLGVDKERLEDAEEVMSVASDTDFKRLERRDSELGDELFQAIEGFCPVQAVKKAHSRDNSTVKPKKTHIRRHTTMEVSPCSVVS